MTDLVSDTGPDLTKAKVLAAHAQFGALDWKLVKKAMGTNWPSHWETLGPGEGIFALARGSHMIGALIIDAGAVIGFWGFIWYLWDKHANAPVWLLGSALLCFAIGSLIPDAPAKVWHEYGDPYECFGAGRYDAMRDGRVCPGWEDK